MGAAAREGLDHVTLLLTECTVARKIRGTVALLTAAVAQLEMVLSADFKPETDLPWIPAKSDPVHTRDDRHPKHARSFCMCT